jgi:CDP-ribitol ribitolphosphotransferase
MKELGYIIFAMIYKICCLGKAEPDTVFEIMTHDPSETGNIKTFERYMLSQDDYIIYSITKAERDDRTIKGMLKFLFMKPAQMAKAGIILMDNAFIPMAFFKVRKSTKVIQLWHGTATIKKFGQDANVGKTKKYEYKLNQNITNLIVSSESLIDQYSQAFGVKKDRVFATGLPRTDAVIDYIFKYGTEGNKDYKKYILYAPTFRDNEVDDPKLHLDIERLLDKLPEDYVIMLRLHPYVASKFANRIDPKYDERVIDVSKSKDLLELMGSSCCLITDYSSIIFEYLLFDKPMYFAADDIEEFSEGGRGFYEPYEEFVPGPVIPDAGELAKAIVSGDKYDYTPYIERFYGEPDNECCKRIYELI